MRAFKVHGGQMKALFAGEMLDTFSSDPSSSGRGEELIKTSAGEGAFCELPLYGFLGSSSATNFVLCGALL